MGLRISLVDVKWDGVEGATSYEIRVNGKPVATAGAKARKSRVSVTDATVISVVDLPNKRVIQELRLSQEDGT